MPPESTSIHESGIPAQHRPKNKAACNPSRSQILKATEKPEFGQRLPSISKIGKSDRSGVLSGPVLEGGISSGNGGGNARNGSPLSGCLAFSHCPVMEETSLESSWPPKATTHSTLGTNSASRIEDNAKEDGRGTGALLGSLFRRELRDVPPDVSLLAGAVPESEQDLGEITEKGCRKTFGMRAICIAECPSGGTRVASVTSPESELDLGDSTEKGSRKTFGLRAICIGERPPVGTVVASVTWSSLRQGTAT